MIIRSTGVDQSLIPFVLIKNVTCTLPILGYTYDSLLILNLKLIIAGQSNPGSEVRLSRLQVTEATFRNSRPTHRRFMIVNT